MDNQSNQRFAALPQFNAPLVDSSGRVAQAWQWAITALWYKAGATFSQIPTAAFSKQQPGLPITMHDAQTGDQIGQLITGITITLPSDDFEVVETTDGNGNPIFTVTWKAQAAHDVLAGPTSGASASPTFRLLVSADLPIATVPLVGAVKPDNTTITIDPDGTIHAAPPSSLALTNSHIFVGSAANVATDVAMSGDATIANTGAVALAASGVAAGSYGDASHYTTFTVDAKGRLTVAASVAVPAGVSGANPSATASDVAVNGVATTYMRSDAAPAVQKAGAAQFGLAKPDNTSIVAVGGIFSTASGGNGGYVGGAPPSFVQFAKAVVGGNSVTFGVAPTNGNLLVAIAFNPASGAVGAGWTLIANNVSGTDFGVVASKVAGAGESTTQTPLSGVGGTGVIAVWEVSGQDVTAPFAFAATQAEQTSSSSSQPVIAPNATNLLGLSAVGVVTATIIAGYNNGTQDALDNSGTRKLLAGHTDLSKTPTCGCFAVCNSTTFSSKSASALIR